MNKTLLKWKQFPILLSSTKDNITEDQFYDFEVYIQQQTGVVYQRNIPPPEILYKYARNSAVGSTWDNHNKAFFQFILQENLEGKKICEIGSGNGTLALLIGSKYKIDCYEPTPGFSSTENINLIKDFFENTTQVYDIIILSHTFEHLPDIDSFLSTMYKSLTPGGKLIISIPNFEAMLENNFINTFNTEHITYFTPKSIKNKFNRNGFQNCRLSLYGAHSIFISGSREVSLLPEEEVDSMQIVSLVENYIRVLDNKINFAKELVQRCSEDIYIFGCHAMASIFLNLSQIDQARFKGIIDNDPLKWNTRLYGTNLYCFNPEIAINSTILLNGSTYHQEILSSLLKLNCNVLEWN